MSKAMGETTAAQYDRELVNVPDLECTFARFFVKPMLDAFGLLVGVRSLETVEQRFLQNMDLWCYSQSESRSAELDEPAAHRPRPVRGSVPSFGRAVDNVEVDRGP